MQFCCVPAAMAINITAWYSNWGLIPGKDKRFLLFSKTGSTASHLIQWGTRGGGGGQAMRWTTSLVLKLRMGGGLPLFPLYAFMACTDNFTYNF